MKDTAKPAARARRATGNGDRPTARRAAEQKARNRDIASRLRKSGRIAALGGDIADMAEQGVMLALSADEGYEQIRCELAAIGQAARDEAAMFSEGPRLIDQAAIDTAGLRHHHRESGRSVMRELRMHPGLFEEIQSAEKSATLAQDALTNYRTALKEADKLLKNLVGLSEKFDIASINASLEAGKSPSDAVFIPLSEQARTYFTGWNASVERFAALIAEQKRIAGDASGKNGEILDRIRALGAMVKGVRTSFEDIGSGWDATFTLIDRLTAETASCAKTMDLYRSADTVWNGGAELKERLNLLFDADNSFCDAIDNLAGEVERVSRTAADYSERSVKADDLIDAAEQILGLYPEVSSLADPVADELAAFERTVADYAENFRKSGDFFSSLDCACVSAEEAVTALSDSYRSIHDSMSASLDVLRQAVREFANLHDEQRGMEAMLETLRDGIASMSRFEGRFAVSALRLDSLAAMSGVEVRNAGDRAGGFSSIPGRFSGIAAGQSDAAAETGNIADDLNRNLAEVTRAVRNFGWRERMLYARTFAAALEEAVKETRDISIDTCSNIALSLSGCRTALRDARTASSMDARLSAVADMIVAARDSLTARRKVITGMVEATERLAGYAESMAVELE